MGFLIWKFASFALCVFDRHLNDVEQLPDILTYPNWQFFTWTDEKQSPQLTF